MIIPDIVRISGIAYKVEHRADLNDGEKSVIRTSGLWQKYNSA